MFSVYSKFLLLFTFFILIHGREIYTQPSMGPRIHSFFLSFIHSVFECPLHAMSWEHFGNTPSHLIDFLQTCGKWLFFFN